GEFLSGKFASPVYALFGKKGVIVDEPPTIDTPVGDFIGYHNRTGKHDVTDYDWTQYLNFAARHWGK
ncbi:MAG: acetylxylan esterase, partial [Verrucomicrobiaceae bacterium]|nr:acetylxylan esterase [Verrucomicrobiaceae bacterium]